MTHQSDDNLVISQNRIRLPTSIESSREAFSSQRALVFPNAIDRDILTRLNRTAKRSHFAPNRIEGVGHREIESPPIIATAIDLLLSRTPLYRWLEQATGCKEIASIKGAVARTRPSPGDGLDWHDDLNTPSTSPRRLAITIALEDLNYDGGLFELRRVGSNDPIFSFKHEQAGTVVIFEVSAELEHRVSPLISGGPRLVYAGWFIG